MRRIIGGVTLFVSFIVFAIAIAFVLDYTNKIKKTELLPPDIATLKFLSGKKISCGVMFTGENGSGKLFTFFTTDDGKWFTIVTGEMTTVQAWIDSNGDGVPDGYYEGEKEYARLKEKYPKPCDVLRRYI
ncbi:MAG: hypothetical protein AAB362_03290 [Patescibacteria group bacterium]